jgi:hypothetical protein
MKWDNSNWTYIGKINNGQTYKKGDGIRVRDINAIFNNIFSLKGN